jgi:hypothetical protein
MFQPVQNRSGSDGIGTRVVTSAFNYDHLHGQTHHAAIRTIELSHVQGPQHVIEILLHAFNIAATNL